MKTKKKVRKYAGGTPDEPIQPMDQGSPAQASGAGSSEGSDAEAEDDIGDKNEVVAPVADSNDNITTGQATSETASPDLVMSSRQNRPESNESENNDNEVKVTGQKPAVRQLQELNNDDAAFKADLTQGKINPKTMQDLYNNKNTLGKLGTLFGLLVSGAGSGLAHQSNAMLDMIQNELNRDLEAQKTSAHNKQSWYTLGQQHQQLNAQLPGIQADSQMKVDNATMNRMRLGIAYQVYPEYVSLMPPGPEKDRAVKYLQAVQAGADQANAAGNANTVGRSNMINALQNSGKPSGETPDGGPINMDKFSGLRQADQNFHVEGKTISPSDASAINNEAPALNRNRSLARAYPESFAKLQSLTAAGQGPEMAGQVAKTASSFIPFSGASAAQSVGESAHLFQTARNAEIQKLVSLGMDEKEANNLLPSGYDLGNEETRKAKFKNAIEVFKNHEQALSQNSRNFGVLTPFPTISYPEPEKTRKMPKATPTKAAQ